MSQPEKPPDGPFCMQCGPGTVMDAQPSAGRLLCPRCGEQSRLPALPLFVVTGASGAGKSTITEPLRGLLPGCVVLEADVTLHIAELGWETWRNTWLQLAHAVGLCGRSMVLTGSLTPEQLEYMPARSLIGPIHFANLDCPDDVLAARLRARPAWRGTSSEAALSQHQRFAAWLRSVIQPSFDTSAATPDEVATQVAEWVTTRL
jgi:chloramphenicol 3-O-phosphotransferase